jgi:hypothetical protein
LYKIHGCQTRPDSLVAATSQLEAAGTGHLWGDPQVAAQFQRSTILFLGFSGSVPRISHNMATVAAWSREAHIKHYAVDISPWDEFRAAAAAGEFVDTAEITRDEFFSESAEAFLPRLLLRLLRQLLLYIAREKSPEQFRELVALYGDVFGFDFASPDHWVDRLDSLDAMYQMIALLVVQFQEPPPSIRANQDALGIEATAGAPDTRICGGMVR